MRNATHHKSIHIDFCLWGSTSTSLEYVKLNRDKAGWFVFHDESVIKVVVANSAGNSQSITT